MKSSLRVAFASLLVALVGSCMTPTEETPPPVDEVVDLSAEDEAVLEVFGQQCGAVVCVGKTHCCNASCSRCVPLGVECPQEACAIGDTGDAEPEFATSELEDR